MCAGDGGEWKSWEVKVGRIADGRVEGRSGKVIGDLGEEQRRNWVKRTGEERQVEKGERKVKINTNLTEKRRKRKR